MTDGPLLRPHNRLATSGQLKVNTCPSRGGNNSPAFDVRHFPTKNCLKTQAYANVMQILGYPAQVIHRATMSRG